MGLELHDDAQDGFSWFGHGAEAAEEHGDETLFFTGVGKVVRSDGDGGEGVGLGLTEQGLYVLGEGGVVVVRMEVTTVIGINMAEEGALLHLETTDGYDVLFLSSADTVMTFVDFFTDNVLPLAPEDTSLASLSLPEAVLASLDITPPDAEEEEDPVAAIERQRRERLEAERLQQIEAERQLAFEKERLKEKIEEDKKQADRKATAAMRRLSIRRRTAVTLSQHLTREKPEWWTRPWPPPDLLTLPDDELASIKADLDEHLGVESPNSDTATDSKQAEAVTEASATEEAAAEHEQRREEEAKLAEESQRKAEEARLAEQRQAEEAQRKLEEQRKEEKRRSEEMRRAEEAKLEEQRIAEIARLKAEEARLREEDERRLEEERRAEDEKLKRQQEQLAEEQRRAERERVAQEARAAEEERIANEERELLEQYRASLSQKEPVHSPAAEAGTGRVVPQGNEESEARIRRAEELAAIEVQTMRARQEEEAATPERPMNVKLQEALAGIECDEVVTRAAVVAGWERGLPVLGGAETPSPRESDRSDRLEKRLVTKRRAACAREDWEEVRRLDLVMQAVKGYDADVSSPRTDRGTHLMLQGAQGWLDYRESEQVQPADIKKCAAAWLEVLQAHEQRPDPQFPVIERSAEEQKRLALYKMRKARKAREA